MKKILIILTVFLLTGCNTVENNTKTANNLSEAYQEYFDIGVAITSRNINTLIDENMIDEFDTFTAEYEMKWDKVQYSKDTFNFEYCDIIYDFAVEHNKTIRGHTLMWYKDVPLFIQDIINSDDANKVEEVLSLFETYYTNMYNKYGDVINVWDIANEIIDDNTNILYRDSIYYKLCNYDDDLYEEFIANIFKIVKRVSPEVKRYYNDYFLLTDDIKREKVISFIERINLLGADVQGIGMQSHITTSITKNQVDKALSDFRECGLLVSFTELDISIYEDSSTAPTSLLNYNLSDYEDKLSRAYNHVFSAARENKDIVENITFWGIYDKESWLVGDFYNYRVDYPLLFDEYYNKKKAYYIVKDFEVLK